MPRLHAIDDDTPLIIREEDLEGGAVAVCRCGMSDQWPYCDGTHQDVQDEGDDLYVYEREDGTVQRQKVEVGDLPDSVERVITAS